MKNQIERLKLQFLLVLLTILSSISAARAATITVTNTNVSGEGSLRQAIFDADPGDTINFNLPGCLPESPCVIQVPAELVINKNLAIQGPAANLLKLDGLSSSRVFRVTAGTTATIDGLRIFGGKTPDPGGAGILNSGGILTVSNCVIEHNQTNNSGGGLLNNNGGTAIIINSTISDNSAFFNGGGLANNASGTMKIINSTIASNHANRIGGGISNLGSLSVTNATIAGNSAGLLGSVNPAAGINAAGSETLANTIVAANSVFSPGGTPDDIAGTIETAGHNLIGDAATSGGILEGVNGNIVGNGGFGTIDVATVLLILFAGDFGGTTLTISLAAGSPAKDAGSNSLAIDAEGDPIVNDQRGVGFARVVNSIVDIGAFEQQTLYNFTGFFQPIENNPNLNIAAAGSSIPVKFSLGGNFGLNIFAPGYPKSIGIACDTGQAGSNIEETVTAGGSSLTYDAASNQYKYVWKTDKAWKETCRQLLVGFNDGSEHFANFRFK